jgi:hypothetical protein
MIIDIPRPLDELYTGSGIYLVAIASDGTLRALERVNSDAATRSFAARHKGLRIAAAVGSAHQVIIAPDDCGDLRWSTDQATAIWHARDVLAGRAS